MATDSQISALGIGKMFATFRALSDVSLDIERGEFLTLLGPSGSGKTTLLMILAGFQTPTEGRLLAAGADITHLPAEQRACGMVFQGYALFPHLTVEANIAFPLRVRRRPAGEIRRRVAAMVARVGLSGHEKKRPAALSGGQQQRVALARALIFEPAVLLLDEPFSALDKSLREQMQVEVKRLHEDSGTTFVFVTHDQTEALALSSRIAIFNHGHLLQVGGPREVYDHPATRFVAEFLGDINLLPVSDAAPAGGGMAARCEDRTVVIRDQRRLRGDVLGVRPEHMSWTRAAPPDGQNGLAAIVERRTYLGGGTRLQLRTGGGSALVLSVPTASLSDGPEPGQSVWVTWPAERGFLLPAGT